MFWPLPGGCASTCVTAGAVIGAFVGAVLTGVVTEGALVPICKTPPLALVATSAIIEEPAGGRRGWQRETTGCSHVCWSEGVRCRPRVSRCAGRACVRACVFAVQVLVPHHDVEQLVQSSLSGPVHCRQVTSHRWQVPCGLKYSPADGDNTKACSHHFYRRVK